MALSVEIVPCLTDNYAYLLTDSAACICAVVDPSEPDPVKRALSARGLQLTHILNTHHHFDHTGGNIPLKEEFGAIVVGPGKDADRIPGLDVGVDDTSSWSLGGYTARVLEIPAHTRAHIAYHFVDEDIVFTGDTLFAMGCGRLFEGTPRMMWESLSKLVKLPEETRVYCGHEYTLNNGRFALTIEPHNAALQARMHDVEALRAKFLPTIPSTIALEKETNPFLRPDSAEIRKTLRLEREDDVTVFADIRRRKDVF